VTAFGHRWTLLHLLHHLLLSQQMLSLLRHPLLPLSLQSLLMH
jgi:hypothetical protein